MKVILVLLAGFLLVTLAQDHYFVKSRSNSDIPIHQEQEVYRRQVRAANTERYAKHNEKYPHQRSGPNKFHSLTPEEFKATHLGVSGLTVNPKIILKNSFNKVKPNVKLQKSDEFLKVNIIDIDIEKPVPKDINANRLLVQTLPQTFYVDWSGVNASWVTSPKDQGACGSCWAFSGLGEIESFFLKYHNMYLDLAEQQMLDCASEFYGQNDGCTGLFLDTANNYSSLHQVTTEKHYPYFGVDNPCHSARVEAGAYKIKSYSYSQGCQNIIYNLLNEHPLNIYLLVDDGWMGYIGGVIQSCNNGNPGGHGGVLVGIKYDGSGVHENNYWKIKNSWGQDWGQNGFVRLYYDPTDTTGMCSICTLAVYTSS